MATAEQSSFWIYRTYSEAEVKAFETKVISLFKARTVRSFSDFVHLVCSETGLARHPSFAHYIKRPHSDVHTLEFRQIKVDLKSLIFVFLANRFSEEKVTGLRFWHSGLSPEAVELLLRRLTLPESGVTHLEFAYETGLASNPLLPQLADRTLNIESLSFPSCELGPEVVSKLIAKIKEATSPLRALDLYSCKLSPKNLEELADLMETHNLFEFIGLGRNNVGAGDAWTAGIAALGKVILPVPCSDAQVEEYRKREKEWLALADKNKKLRALGKKEQPLFALDPMKRGPEGAVLLRNSRLRLIDLRENCLSSEQAKEISQNLLNWEIEAVIVLFLNKPELEQRVLCGKQKQIEEPFDESPTPQL